MSTGNDRSAHPHNASLQPIVMNGHLLKVCRASRLHLVSPATDPPWLVEQLWTQHACGILGGEPKCGKSLLALDIAASVASGTACLGRFGVPRPGRVLFFAAEDALDVIHQRLQAIAHQRQLQLDAFNLYFITTPIVRLDDGSDRARLKATVERGRPRLLILDPFVRLHAVDENAVAAVAPLLAFLRSLQRKFHTAVLLVHHARKAASHLRPGQALRGSSELHAWSDSSLYLRRRGDLITLVAEHRAAAAPDPLALALVNSNNQHNPHLEIVQTVSASLPHERDLEERLITALNSSPMSRAQLRQTLSVRNERLGHLLDRLAASGRIVYTDHLWRVPL